MKQKEWFISTIDPQAHLLAARYGLGLEIAEFCTAYNMDGGFPETDAIVSKKLERIALRTLHAPFNELFPCAIDPEARALARRRYRQAIALAQGYHARKIIIHAGYNPRMYYPCWFTEQSVLFWRDFLAGLPENVELCLENVFEEEPGMLLEILKAVNDPRLRLCLDLGHVNVYSKIPAEDWIQAGAPYISHLHIHNNDSTWDTHSSLNSGTLPMEYLLYLADALCPTATFTLELQDCQASIRWLAQKGFLHIPP